MRKTIVSIMILLVAVIFVVAITGCSSQISCESPSKVIGNKCCVDKNNNDVCDTEEVAPELEVEALVEPEVPAQPEALVEPEVSAQPEAPEESATNYDEYLDSLAAPQRSKINSVRRLAQEALKREENYFYRYSGPGTLQNEFWVKGDQIKTQIYEPNKLDKFTKYNMVFIDRAKGTAQGYCEPAGKGKCWGGHGPFTETVVKNMRKTPKDWLEELGDEFHYAAQNKINDVLYYIVDYATEDGLYRVYLESWRGWPSRVELYKTGKPGEPGLDAKPDQRWLYDDMDVGSVAEDDVIPNRVYATVA